MLKNSFAFTMISVPLAIGFGVVISASFVNHMISTRYNGTLNAWYGWVTAGIIRFSAIIFSGLYVITRDSVDDNAPGFMFTLLFTILAGVVVDLFISLYRIYSSYGKEDQATVKVVDL